MFYQEGDENVGATVTSFAKCMYFSISNRLRIAKPKNCAGNLDLPPMPR